VKVHSRLLNGLLDRRTIEVRWAGCHDRGNHHCGSRLHAGSRRSDEVCHPLRLLGNAGDRAFRAAIPMVRVTIRALGARQLVVLESPPFSSFSAQPPGD
jgi:hypothetical protein